MDSVNPLFGDNLVGEALTLDQILSLALESVNQSLRKFAVSPEFIDKVRLAFGESFAPEAALSLAQDWAKGDVTVPPIQVLPAATLNGAYGGYAIATNTIYLSEEFLRENTLSTVTSAILEEFGHSVDGLLNDSDSLGDEGQIFAGLVQGIPLPESELQALKEEDDFATIVVDGQIVEIEQAVISGNGGQGGTTQTIPLEAAPLTLVKFNWQNFSIPDEFRILYEGRQIAGNVGLQSGGGRGEKIVVKNNSEELVVQVTAPLQGTAWNFIAETLPLEININGLLGDVVEVDLVKEFTSRGISLQDAGLNPNGFGLRSNSNNKGQVAEIDNWQTELQKGKFYFVPTVNGTPRQLSQARSDAGLGESTLTITNGDIEFPIKFNVTDGFSSTGDNRVTVGTQRLDIYRQEQRLSYLAFQQQTGNNLVVDGNNSDLPWAIQLFNIATSQRPLGSYSNGGRGRVANHPSTLRESDINSSNVPQWKNLNGIQNFNFVATQRRFGTNNSALAIQGATNALGVNINSTGVTGRNGSGDPSTSHDGGRGVDIDTIPREAYDAGRNFFLETRINNVWYVAAPNNQIIVRNPNGTYQSAAPTPQNLVNAVRGNQAFNNELILNGVSGFLLDNSNIGYNLNDIQTLIQSFQNTGLVGRVLYNDPRTWGGNVGFSSGHNGHVHFEITTPALAPNVAAFNLQNSELSVAGVSPLIFAGASLSGNLSNAIELGQLEGNVNIAGSISSANPDIYYRFTLGNPIEEDEAYFFSLRDFSLLLNGLSGDADVELIQDFNGDNIRQDYEVVASSEEIGNSNETIELTDLSPNVYYVRVFQKSGDTNYNLSLTVPPLPVPPDNAGNTPSNAQDLGILSGNLTRTDFIGEVDPDDYYRFKITNLSDLSLEVSGLDQGDLVATLGQDTNNDGVINFDEIIALSDAEGNEPEALNINGLAAGTYYVWLSRNSGNTDYNLNLSATPAVIPSDRAGSTPSTAFDIGSLSSASNFSDFVGNVDPEDYYRFSLGNVSGLTIQLDGLSADADLELAQDTNNDGVIDFNEIIRLSELEGAEAEVININALAAGTYFVRVHQYEGDTNYNLSFEPTNPFGVDLSVTRTDSTGAVDLGDPFSYTLALTNNGPSLATNIVLTENLPFGAGFDFVTGSISTPPTPLNYVDIFEFQLDAGDRVTIDLDGNEFGSFLNSVLRLFDANGNQLAVSDDTPAPGEIFSLDSYLDFTASSSQTYYIGVSSSPNSSYDPFSESTEGNSLGSYTIDITVGSGGSSNQVTPSEPNNTIPEAFNTGLSSANPGNLLASGFILTDNSFSGFIDSDNDLLTVNWAALASGQTATVNLTFISSTSGDRLSTASVTSNEYDYNLSNNSFLSTKTINPINPADADLELTQTVNNSNPAIGQQVTFTLILTNKGPGTATVIKVQDILPGALSYVSALADLGSYDSNTGIWTVGNMPPNQSVRLRITATVNSGQLLTNTAEVTAVNEGDPDSTPNNNNPSEDDQATVLVDVQNVAPITQANKTLTVLEDAAPTSLNISSPTDANGDTLTITVGTIPNATKGQIRLGNSLVQTGDTLNPQQLTSLVFVPVANANGAAGTFSYTVSDGQGGTAAQTVTLAITPVNDAPLAQDDAATTPQNTPITIAVLANDSDLDGDSISLASFNATSTQGGTVSRDENGTPGNLTDDKLLYTPATGFSGNDSFTYRISDGIDTSTATVSITVTSTSNQPPQAVNDVATATQNTPLTIPGATLLSNDTDPNPGDTLSITGVSNPSNGNVQLNGTNVIFTPAPGFIGQAGFDYSISDGKGGNSSASVNITVNPFLGTPGRDTITGTDLDDILIGGLGADNLTGKQGKDHFVYQNIRDAGDIIKDFEVTQDNIVLTALLNSFGYGGSNPIADGYLKFGSRGSDAVILIDEDGLAPTKRALPFITVEKVTLAAIQDPNNFIF